MIHWQWIQTVLIGPTPPPPMAITSAAGLSKGFSILGLLLLLLLFTSMTLPTTGSGARWIRLALFPLILYFSLTLAVDRNLVTFGAPLRDCFWPLLAWNFIAKGLDVCLCSAFLDLQQLDRCPRWIVPASQAHKWNGAIKLELDPKTKRKTKTKKGVLTQSKHDDNFSPSQHLGATGESHSESAIGKVEADWYLVPHTSPFFSSRRVLWACDYIFLLRPQTSWIFPREQRAMEWAHGSLTRAAMDPTSSLYGKSEDRSLITVFGKIALLSWLFSNAHLLVIPPGPAYYQLPVYVQLFNVLFYGSLICATSGPFEYLAYPLLRRLLPITTLLPLMNQPLLATGPMDLWGRRWHTMVRRTSWRLARLFPGGGHPLGNKLWAFVITGSMHSFIMARWLPPPPTIWYALVFLIVPGPMAFFVAQGVIAGIELVVFGGGGGGDARDSKGKEQGVVKALVRRMLLWVGIAISCRYFVGAISSTSMHTQQGQRGGQFWLRNG